jgi:hypothetical protein
MNQTNQRIENRRRERGHRFYPSTTELRTLPQLDTYAETEMQDITIWLHYFNAGSDWWIAEYDPANGIAWGYVRLNSWTECAEWGSIPLPQLESLAGLGRIVERDKFWKPRRVRDLKLPGVASWENEA